MAALKSNPGVVTLVWLFVTCSLLSSSFALDFYICVSGDVSGCCTCGLYTSGATCELGSFSVGLITQSGCGNPHIALNFFYVMSDNGKEYWGGCLAAIPSAPLNYSTVTGFQGYYSVTEKDYNRKFSITVTPTS